MARQYMITRDKYREVRKYDHTRFDDYLRKVWNAGYEEGAKAAPSEASAEGSVTMEEFVEYICGIVGSVKGIGTAKLADVKAALSAELIEKEAER